MRVDIRVVNPDLSDAVLPEGFTIADRLWTPAEITTELWLDADDSSTITLVSGAVSEWRDKSGNSRDVEAPTSGQRPDLIASELNTHDVLRFSNHFMEGTENLAGLAQDADAVCIFAVYRHSATTGVQQIVGVNNGAVVGQVRAALGSGVVSGQEYIGGRRLDGDSFQSRSSGESVGTAWHVRMGLLDYANAESQIWKDGTIQSSGAFQTAGQTSNTAPLFLAIGRNVSLGVNRFIGDLAEVVITNEAPTTETRQIIEGYLGHKWGLEANLPAEHPYKSAPPVVAP